METPPPDRLTYFPPPAIFGRRIVPVYVAPFGPSIPVQDVAASLGIKPAQAAKIVSRNLNAISAFDAASKEIVSEKSQISASNKNICIGMDGVALLTMNVDPEQLDDDLMKERIAVAKQWIMAQIANRIKIPGQKHQPRWDAGLTKDQSKELKKKIDRLSKLESGQSS